MPTGPALRAGDTVLCPLMDGPKPHVGGPITPAASVPTVLIGGFPAARLGDLSMHGTPIAPGPGCPTVIIGG